MKKALFSFLAVLAMVVALNATPTVNLYEPISGNVTWDSAAMTAEVGNYQNTYSIWLVYKPKTDTVWHTTTPATYNNFDWPIMSLSGLPANDTIFVYACVASGADTGMSATISFKTLPSPHKAYIGTPQVISSPAQTLVTFPYNVSVPTIFFVRYNAQQNVSDTLWVNTPGSGTGVVVITNPNVSGVTYGGNILRGRSISGIVPDSTRTLPSFTVPSWSNPDVSDSLTFLNVAQGSYDFKATITLGNSSSGVVTVRDLDSVGNVDSTRAVFFITHDTTITWSRVCMPYTKYGQRVIVTTNGGSDSTTAFRRTNQVYYAQFLGFDTLNTTVNTTDLRFYIKTNGNPLWPTSNANIKWSWQDKNGVAHTEPVQMRVGNSGIDTVIFTGMNNLKVNPQTNKGTITSTNGAGPTWQDIYFVCKAPLPTVPIDNGWYIEATAPYQVRIQHINAGPSTAPYDVIGLRNVAGSGQVDTFLMRVNQTGYTNFLQWDTFGNQVGNTAYEWRLGTRNVDGQIKVTNMHPIITPPAALPTFFISNSISTTTSTVNYRFSGCANGTPSYARVQVLDNGNVPFVVDQVDLGYLGTGDFDVSNSFTNLDECEDYKLKVIIHNGQLGNQIADNKSFSTTCTTTGIENDIALIKLGLAPNPVSDVLTITADQAIGKCVICSIYGETVIAFGLTGATTGKIDCSFLPSGTYVLKGEGFTEKFVKQ